MHGMSAKAGQFLHVARMGDYTLSFLNKEVAYEEAVIDCSKLWNVQYAAFCKNNAHKNTNA